MSGSFASEVCEKTVSPLTRLIITIKARRRYAHIIRSFLCRKKAQKAQKIQKLLLCFLCLFAAIDLLVVASHVQWPRGNRGPSTRDTRRDDASRPSSPLLCRRSSIETCRVDGPCLR